ncbi:hypothetical protein P4V33_01505 [Brevibacillus borstelensis]|uniref:hypothetical protein n=1 Tax=Brevibacillus borstelensis TaxID=45462 RepID=UPI002E23BBF8|nr:hypothetical protein [Brevibacillus borstelensis]
MNITVNINAPELASAIHALAQSLAGNQLVSSVPSQAPVAAAENVVPLVPQHQPEQVPVTTPPVAPPAAASAPAVPVVPPAQAAPVAPPAAPTQAPTGVPTAAQTYTLDQLAVAATQLVDAGRQAEVVQLLASFGVQALTALPKEHYGAFATQLRAMGAKL